MSKKDCKIYLQHIVDCMDSIQSYAGGMSKEDFLNNKMVQDAVIRNLEIIGEAAKQIPEDIRRKYPGIEWKKMAGLRDVLIHNYMGVDLDEIQKIVSARLPRLRAALKAILRDS